MNLDLQTDLMRGIVTHLEGDASLIAIVPASRIYRGQAPAKPTWPFIRTGAPIVTGASATCYDGIDAQITLHAFAETSTTVSGDDLAARISAIVVARMDSLAPSVLSIVQNDWLQTLIMRDETEADRYHAVMTFRIVAVQSTA